jgi:hypothetical protein
MMSLPMQSLRRATVAIALCATFVGLAASPAHARVFIGVGIPFYGPGFYPAPYYYPPPAYYPPPVVYAPPQNFAPPQSYVPPPGYSPGPAMAQNGGGQACYAGPYVCPMDRPVATGGSCYCLGNGSQRVWGRAN